VRKLLEIAHDFEAHRFFGLSDFARHLRRLADEEPREPQAQTAAEAGDAVRLMTIHQAKGLEFPIVIVADMSRRPPSNSEKIVITPEYGLLMCETAGAGDDELDNPLIDCYRDEIKDQERAEAARILYVAMTRARDRLILSEGASNREWAAGIREAIGFELVADFEKSTHDESVAETAAGTVILRRTQAIAANATAALDRETETSAEELARIAETRLGFAPPVRHELLTSPSALEDFKRCPRQYFFRRELELPEDGIEIFGDHNQAEATGDIAHAVLAQLDPRVTRDPDAEIIRLVDHHCAGVELNAEERQRLIRDLVRYARCNDLAPAPSASVRRETPFFMSLEDGDMTLFVRGRIDLLIDDGAHVLVRDYKYARPGPFDYRVQMECYALAASDALPGRTVGAEIIYLRDGVERRELALPSPTAIRAHLIATGREIAAAHSSRTAAAFPKLPAQALECRRLSCGYVSRCWPQSLHRDT
jgi:ATP-dependent helicase/nuclease subunit A